MNPEPQFLLFGLHITLWSAYQLETAIQELIRDNYIIDPVRSSETKQSLVMRLGRFQQELTQEEVSSITERFQDRGYGPRGAVSRAGRAGGVMAAGVAAQNAAVEVGGDMERIGPNIGDGEPAVAAGPGAAGPGAAGNGAVIINNIQAGIAEGIGMQHQQPQPPPQNNELGDRVRELEALLATERAGFTAQINELQRYITSKEAQITRLVESKMYSIHARKRAKRILTGEAGDDEVRVMLVVLFEEWAEHVALKFERMQREQRERLGRQ